MVQECEIEFGIVYEEFRPIHETEELAGDLCEARLTFELRSRNSMNFERADVYGPIRLQVTVKSPAAEATVNQLDCADFYHPVALLQIETRRFRIQRYLPHQLGPWESNLSIAFRASASARSLPWSPECPRVHTHSISCGDAAGIQAPPQFGILHGLTGGRLPSVSLPEFEPARNAIPHVLRIGGQAHPACAVEGFQRADGRHELHSVVGGLTFGSEDFPLPTPKREDGPQPPGPGFPRHAPSVKISTRSPTTQRVLCVPHARAGKSDRGQAPLRSPARPHQGQSGDPLARESDVRGPHSKRQRHAAALQESEAVQQMLAAERRSAKVGIELEQVEAEQREPIPETARRNETAAPGPRRSGAKRETPQTQQAPRIETRDDQMPFGHQDAGRLANRLVRLGFELEHVRHDHHIHPVGTRWAKHTRCRARRDIGSDSGLRPLR